LAFLALLLALSLSFYRFPEVPNGFFYDEASVGYNAYSISETGADEYGNKYPVFFRCFDNFQDPVYVYSLVPLIKIFGLEKWTTRLPALIFKILAALMLFFCAKRITRSFSCALFCSLIFVIIPWTFVLSRSGMGGYMPMLLGIISGIYFLNLALSTRELKYSVLAGMSWAFTMYSHQIGRPMSAVILFAFVMSFNFLILKRLKAAILFCLTMFVALLPMATYVWRVPESMTKRFSTFSIWGDACGITEILFRFFERYFDYFGASFLFMKGDADLRHNSGYSGQLYFIMAPLVVIGIFHMLKHWRRPFYRFIIFSIALYPLAASLTMDRMHSTRCLNGVPFFCIASAIGLRWIFILSRNRSGFRFIPITVLVVLILESGLYLNDYFYKYPARSRSAFEAPLIQTIETAFKNRRERDVVYVSSSLFPRPLNKQLKPFWYSHFLFFAKIDPAHYQKKGMPEDILYDVNPAAMIPPGIILRMNSKIMIDENFSPYVVVNDEELPSGVKLVSKIALTEGSDRFFEVYQLQK